MREHPYIRVVHDPGILACRKCQVFQGFDFAVADRGDLEALDRKNSQVGRLFLDLTDGRLRSVVGWVRARKNLKIGGVLVGVGA